MDNNNFIIVDGKKIIEKKMPYYFPLSVAKYQESFNDIVQIIVRDILKIEPSNPKFSTYINLLANKSERVKYISMIIEISKVLTLEEVSFDYIPLNFSALFNGKPTIRNQDSKIDLIDKKEIKGAIPKIIANQIFTVLGWFLRKKKNETRGVIRAWVDVDEKLHEDEFYDNTIFIYPFGLNFKRSFKFIKKVFKKHNNVRLVGVNYSFLEANKIIFSENKLDALVNFEFNAMMRHSKKLLNFDVIYTSDEFQSATPALYLNRKTTKVVNKAHGMGCYNLEVDYDIFHVFNDVQQRYYERNNSKIDYKIYSSELKRNSEKNDIQDKIVYIDQGDLSKYGFFYEVDLQKKLVETLEAVNKSSKKEVFIKFHPNRSESEIKGFQNLHSIKTISKLNPKEEYTFINLWSTSYFDFRKFGNFIFVRDNHFNASYFFGNQINSIHIDVLKKKLLGDDI